MSDAISFRRVRERSGEWHIGIWKDRGMFSIRLLKWGFVWDWRTF